MPRVPDGGGILMLWFEAGAVRSDRWRKGWRICRCPMREPCLDFDRRSRSPCASYADALETQRCLGPATTAVKGGS